MGTKYCGNYLRLLGVACVFLATAIQATAAGQSYNFNIPIEPLGQALTDFSRASNRQIIFSEDPSISSLSVGLHGQYTVRQALAVLLASTGWQANTTSAGVLMIREGECG